MPNTMTLIATATVSGATAGDITFNSIPQTYTDLVLVYSLRANGASYEATFPLYFNGNGAGYTFRTLSGDGASVSSSSGSSAQGVKLVAATATANTFSNGQVYISNYTSANNKSYSFDHVTENNATNAVQQIAAGLWSNTAAITSISMQGSSFVQYSTASLYGILKGSGGASVA